MTQVSVGFQIGGEAYREIIFFEDQRAFDEFTNGSFEFSGDVNAVAITAGASATAGTTGASAGCERRAEGRDHRRQVLPGHGRVRHREGWRDGPGGGRRTEVQLQAQGLTGPPGSPAARGASRAHAPAARSISGTTAARFAANAPSRP